MSFSFLCRGEFTQNPVIHNLPNLNIGISVIAHCCFDKSILHNGLLLNFQTYSTLTGTFTFSLCLKLKNCNINVI